MPSEEAPEFEAWIENDVMLRAWLRNSLSPDLQEAFVYIASAKDLWDNLEEKFGQCNGVFINQLKRSIASLKQGDSSVTAYYTKLQRMVDELTAVEPPINCICPARHIIVERKNRDQLIVFLNGLNDFYEPMRNQILLMDPLPSINKAYSLLLQIERQKEISISMEIGAVSIEGKQTRRSTDKKRVTPADKRNWTCTYCKKKGHSKETCFKLHGTPNWYKEMLQKKGVMASNVVEVSADEEEITDACPITYSNAVLEYAGNVSTNFHNFNRTSWLIDSGASSHICSNKDLFTSLKTYQN